MDYCCANSVCCIIFLIMQFNFFEKFHSQSLTNYFRKKNFLPYDYFIVVKKKSDYIPSAVIIYYNAYQVL